MYRVMKDFSHDELIINTHYIRPRNREEDDSLLVVSKNIKTGEKIMREYPKPQVPVYILSPKYKKKDYLEFAKKEELEEHWVSYRYRVFELARLLKFNDFTDKLRKKQVEASHIHLDKRLFGTDLHIEDLVMKEYFKFCLNRDESGNIVIDFPKIDHFDIGGLDIEIDVKEEAEREDQPVIANTVIDNKSWKILTSCLINDRYKGQKEVMEDIDKFKKEFHQILYDHIENINVDEDDPKKKAKVEATVKNLIHSMADQLDLTLTFETDEREVIRKPVEFLFKKANPDICYIYNAMFDIGHMKVRAEKLNMDYDELFQFRPDTPKYTNFIYKNDDPDPKKREHYYNAYNPTKIVDQLLQYAQLRRGKLFASYSLDAVTKREIGVSKLDYSKICSYIGDFPYVDFKMFIIYNIIDVFMMLVLDRMTNDCYSQLYTRLNLCTEWGRIAKPMKRTVNVFDTLADVQGFIAGNEINALFVKLNRERLKKIEKANPGLYNVIMQLRAANTDDKNDNPYRIQGGHVADPNKIRQGTAKNNIYDFPVNVFRKLVNCADLDAASMYPNNIIANNGSKTTLYGILQSINGKTGDNLPQRANLALLNENFSSIGEHFFNLPNVENILQDYYEVKPVYKRRVPEISGYNTADINFDPKNKFMEKYRKLLWKMQNSKYDPKDVEAGVQPISKYFLSNDNNYIRFSYYNTLIELKLEGEGTFNELCGFKNKGFICGELLMKDAIIKDRHEDYISYLAPSGNYPKLGETLFKRNFTDEEMLEMIQAKVKPFTMNLNGHKFNAMGRLLFWDKDSALYPLHGTLSEVINDKGTVSESGVLLQLRNSYDIDKNNRLQVTQSIMLYKN